MLFKSRMCNVTDSNDYELCVIYIYTYDNFSDIEIIRIEYLTIYHDIKTAFKL